VKPALCARADQRSLTGSRPADSRSAGLLVPGAAGAGCPADRGGSAGAACRARRSRQAVTAITTAAAAASSARSGTCAWIAVTASCSRLSQPARLGGASSPVSPQDSETDQQHPGGRGQRGLVAVDQGAGRRRAHAQRDQHPRPGRHRTPRCGPAAGTGWRRRSEERRQQQRAARAQQCQHPAEKRGQVPDAGHGGRSRGRRSPAFAARPAAGAVTREGRVIGPCGPGRWPPRMPAAAVRRRTAGRRSGTQACPAPQAPRRTACRPAPPRRAPGRRHLD